MNKACCTLAKVVVDNYEPNGAYSDIDGVKTYITGATTSNIAIIVLYDIFGLAIQTLQGADLIAKSLDAVVFMPDFLDGGLSPDLVPTDTPEKQQAVKEFLSTKGDFEGSAEKVVKFQKVLQSTYSSIEKVAAFGLCWGGKVAILSSNRIDNALVASAQGHPGRLSAEDAKKLKIPHLTLNSKDEDAVEVKLFGEVQKPAGSETHTYDTMHHGWMGARAKLGEEEFRVAYEKAYQQLVNWLQKVLS